MQKVVSESVRKNIGGKGITEKGEEKLGIKRVINRSGGKAGKVDHVRKGKR